MHAHLQDEAFDGIVPQIMDEAAEQGLEAVVCAGTTINDWEQVLALSESTNCVLPALGVHPWYVNDNYQKDGDQLCELAPKLCAIGETGLDSLRGDTRLQMESLKIHIDIAKSHNLPLVIHCVKAFDEMYAILNKTRPAVPVLFHGFNSSTQLARQMRKVCDCYFSLSPSFCSPDKVRKRKTSELVRYLYNENLLLLESDAPFPVSVDHKKASTWPSDIAQSLKNLSGVLETTEEITADQIFKLSSRMFNNKNRIRP